MDATEKERALAILDRQADLLSHAQAIIPELVRDLAELREFLDGAKWATEQTPEPAPAKREGGQQRLA